MFTNLLDTFYVTPMEFEFCGYYYLLQIFNHYVVYVNFIFFSPQSYSKDARSSTKDFFQLLIIHYTF